jgi:hypothetical protein
MFPLCIWDLKTVGVSDEQGSFRQVPALVTSGFKAEALALLEELYAYAISCEVDGGSTVMSDQVFNQMYGF